MSLQMQSLLKVFECLDIEERQKLLPILVEKAGIFSRNNIDNILDEKEKQFVKFLFGQMLPENMKLQYINKCRILIEKIKEETRGGKIWSGEDMYKNTHQYYTLYQNVENVEKVENVENVENQFLNLEGEKISKEEYFDKILFQENDCWKDIKIIKNGEISTLVRLLNELK